MPAPASGREVGYRKMRRQTGPQVSSFQKRRFSAVIGKSPVFRPQSSGLRLSHPKVRRRYDGSSRMRKWFPVVCFSLAIDAGCTSSPRLVFQKGTRSDSEYLAKVFNAPIVIVGVIDSDTLVRAPIRWEGTTIQLRKLKVRVENVLRGNAIPDTATVYYSLGPGDLMARSPLVFGGASPSEPHLPPCPLASQRLQCPSYSVRRVG